jgi:hypothetical protein
MTAGKLMTTSPPRQLDMIARIERALVLLAYFIELDDDVHVPMYEKFETELAALKATADTRSRASQRLAAFRRSGERNALILPNAVVQAVAPQKKRRTKPA